MKTKLPPAQIAPASRMSPEDERQAFELMVPGRCFPLSGHCGKPIPLDRWLCDEHEIGGIR